MDATWRVSKCGGKRQRPDVPTGHLALRTARTAVVLAAALLAAPSPATGQQADIAVSLAVSPAPQVTAASGLTWTATVQNLDPATDAHSPELTVVLPPGVTYQGVTAPVSWACSENSLTVTCTAALLAAGDSVVITVDTLAPADPDPAGEDLVGTASVGSATTDPDPANDSSQASVTAVPSADLSVAAAFIPDPVTAAQPLDLTVTCSNAGPSTARALQVTAPVPAGAAYAGFTGTDFACSEAAGTVTCTGPDLASSQSVVLTLHFQAPDEGGAVGTTVAVTASTDDPDASNDTAAASVTVEPSADLSLALAASPEPVDAAAALTFTADITNGGPSTATGVTFTLTLDPALAYAGFSGTGWSCSEAGGTVSCAGPDLAGGQVAQVTVTATAPASGGDVTSTGTVGSSVSDPDPGNDTVTVTTAVTPVADLWVTVDDGLTTAVAGETRVTVTMIVANDGPSQVAGASVTLPRPSDLVSAGWTCSVVSGVASCGAAGGAGGIDTVADLEPGARVQYRLTALVAPDAEGVPCGGGECLDLQGSVVPPAGVEDPDSSNDTGADQDTVLERVADLEVAKDDGMSQVLSGQAYRYTVQVSNPGPSTVEGISVADAIPAELHGHPDDCAADPSQPCWSCEPARVLRFQERVEENQGTPQVAGMEGASGVAVSPDGRFVFVAGTVDNAVVSLERETSHAGGGFGSLSYVGMAPGIQGPSAVALSPDGADLYVAAPGENAVVALSVDQGSGALGEIGRWTDGVGGVTGLAGVSAVAVSPDGLLVAAAATTTDAVTFFARDPGTGLLSFAGSVAGDATVLLDGVDDLAFSPDGAFLYAAAPGDSAVTVLAVDPSGPALSPVVSTVDAGLAGVRHLALTPDGAHLAAAGATGGFLVIFSRDAAGGGLTVLERWQDGVDGVTGLEGISGVAVTPDGRRVLTVAEGSRAVAVFHRTADPGDPGFGHLAFLASFDGTDLGGLSWAAPAHLAVTPGGRHVLVTDGTRSTLDVLATAFGTACPAASGNGDLGEIVTVPAGGFLTYTVSVALDPSATGSVSNTASITPPPGVDGNPANDTATDTDTVVTATDLAVVVDDGTTVAVPGTGLDTTLTVTNQGTVAAPGSTVTFDPPIYDGVGVTAGYVAGSVTWQCVASGGACCQAAPPCGTAEAPVTGSGAVAQTVDLPPAGELTFTVHGILDPAATGTLAQQAAVTPPPSVADVDPSNDTGADTDTTLAPEPDLQVYKVHGALTGGPPVDWQVVWTVTIHNIGPSRAVGATVHDGMPPEVSSASWTCTVTSGGGACSDGSGTGDVNTTVDLDPGGTASFQITAVIPQATPPGVVQNTAQAAVPGDPDAGNNRWTDELQVGVSADLSATLTDGLSTATPGEELTYVFTVQNAGPTDVQGASVDTTLPAVLRNVTWTCSSATPVPGILTFLEKDAWAGATGGASGVAVSQDGEMVYVAASTDNALAVFSRETAPGTSFGKLTFLEAEVDGHDDVTDAGVTVDGLEGASAVAVTPDGRYIYVAGTAEDAVSVFHHDSSSDAVSFVEVERDGQDDPGDAGATADGLAAPVALAVSPDGTSLYVAGHGDDAVAVMDIAGGTGRLSFRQSLTTADIGGTGLTGASAVAVSPDGSWVAVAGEGDDTLALFSRSAATGELTLVDLEQDGVDDPSDTAGPVQFMSAPSDVAFSPDGRFVYVASPATDHVVGFTLDGATGELAYLASWPGTGASPGVDSLAVSEDGEHLLAGQSGENRLLVFRRQVNTGILTFQELHTQGVNGVDGLEEVRDIAVTGDGLNVLAAGAQSGAVAVFDRQGPQPETPQLEVERDGVDDAGDLGPTVDGLYGAWPVLVSPDGAHVYVGGYGDDAVAVFSRHPGMGLSPATRGQHLVYLGETAKGSGVLSALDGPVALAASPDPLGSELYVACRDAASVVVLDRDTDPASPTYGMLTPLQEVVDGTGGVEGLAGASAVVVEPSGGRVYVAGRYAASIAVFDRAGDGTLSFAGRIHDGSGGVSGLAEVSALAISADGAHLYASSAQANDVLVFELRPGALPRLIQTVDAGLVPSGLEEPLGMALAPDAASSHLYLACRSSDSLIVFERDSDPTSSTYGWLHPVEIHSGESEGLHGVRSVAVSPDGTTVYAGAEYGNDLAVFHRESDQDSPSFGSLTLVEVRRRTDRNVGGLEHPYGVAVSPDSRNLYVASLGDGSLAAFTKRSGSACPAGGVGEIHGSADLSVGGTATYTIQGTIDPMATGTLSATGTVTVPDQAVETDPSDNSSTDTTDLVPVTALSVTKDDGRFTVGAGTRVSYTVKVTNRGPSHAPGVGVTDIPAPADFQDVSWTCDAVGSGRLSLQQLLDGEGFGGAADVALLPDPDGGGPLLPGAVAVSVQDDAVILFERDPSSGTLTPVQTVYDGDTAGGLPVDGLDGARAVAVSGDGWFVYVGSQVDDAVAVFRRDATSGLLLPVDLERDGWGGVDGLDRVQDVLLSDDGAFLYAAGANDSAVAVFARDGVTGELTFLEAERDGADDPGDPGGTVTGLTGVAGLALSPGPGHHLYAAGAVAGTVAVFERDPVTGLLSFLEAKGSESTGGLAGASAVAVSADGSRVVVAGRRDDAVVVLARVNDPLSPGYGTLTPIQVLQNGQDGVHSMSGPAGILMAPDGEHLWVAAHRSGAVVLLATVDAEGRLGFLEVTEAGGLAGVSGLALSGSGANLYTAAMIGSAVGVWDVGQESSCPASGSGGLSAVPVSVAAGGSVVFTVGATVRSDAQGAPCPDDPSVGCVTNTATVNGPADPDPSDNAASDTDALDRRADLAVSKTDHHAVVTGLAGASDVVTTPGGGFVYTAGPDDDSVAIFRLDTDPASAEFGRPAYVASVRDGSNGVSGLDGVRALAVSPDGGHLYAAASTSGSVAVFAIGQADGSLSFVQRIANNVNGASGLAGAADVAVSRDGRFVYVAGSHENAVAVLSREADPASPEYGRLTPAGVVVEGEAGVSGLVGVRGLALSDDGQNLYSVAPSGDLAVFRLNGDGSLAQIQVLSDGADGVAGLGGASDVVVTADGSRVYATGADPGSVVVFARDPGDGTLTFSSVVSATDAGVEGLEGAEALALSPGDEGYLYVACGQPGAVVVFARDPASGALSFLERWMDGDPAETSGLGGAAALALSPDGEHLYAVGAASGTLAFFQRGTVGHQPPPEGRLEFGGSIAEGGGGIAAGSMVEYLITVENLGPADASGIRVQDLFPAELGGVAWTCAGEDGGSCPAAGTGAIDVLVDIPAGGRVLFTGGGVVRPRFAGMLSNTATVAAASEPPGTIDPDPTNNEATDDDTLVIRRADLALAMAGPPTAVPGGLLPFTVTASNLGSGRAEDSIVNLFLPPELSGVSWTCTAQPAPGLLSLLQGVLPVTAPQDVVLSPDGTFVYVSGTALNGRAAIAVLRRDPSNGTLQDVEVVSDGESQDTDGDGNPDTTVDGLGGITALALSPDGNFLYAAGTAEDAVAWFSRDPSDGTLVFGGVARSGVAGVRELGDVADLAVSPDGSLVYAASPADGAVVTLAVSGSGALSFAGSAGISSGIGALDGARALAVSADGRFVYAAAAATSSVVVLEERGGGDLRLVQALAEGDEPAGSGGPTVHGIAGASGVALSPDGSRVWVTGAAGAGVARFARDESSGELQFVASVNDGDVQGSTTVTGLAGAMAPVPSPDGGRLYVAGRDHGAVVLLAEDRDEPLTFVAAYDAAAGVTGLDAVSGLAMGPGGDQLYAAGGAAGAVDVLSVAPGSSCPESGLDVPGAGIPVDLSPGGSATFSLTGRVAATAEGTLHLAGRVSPDAGLDDPDLGNNEAVLDVALAPQAELSITKDDGRTSVTAGTATTYTITVTNAGPSAVNGVEVQDVVPLYPGDPAGLEAGSVAWTCQGSGPLAVISSADPGAGAASVAVRPDGRFVYAVLPSQDALAVLSRDVAPGSPTWGALALVTVIHEGDTVDGTPVSGLAGASWVAVSADGAVLYVAGETQGTVAVFSLDQATGLPSPLQTLTAADADGLEGARFLVSSPDGAFLYVSGGAAASVVVFRRSADGTLTWSSRVRDGLGGFPLNSLVGVRGLALSPDGAFLYAAAEGADALTVMRRDPDDGSLSFVMSLQEGASQSTGLPTVEGLGLVQQVAVTPDGGLVLAAALAGDAVTVFERDPTTGGITEIQALRDSDPGVDLLDGATAVLAGPQGDEAYVASRNDDAVVVLRRDWASSTFEVAGALGGPGAGPSGLDGPVALARAPEGTQLLAAGLAGGPVVALERVPRSVCHAGSGTGDVLATLDLEPGGSATFTVNGTVHPAARGTLANTATVTPPAGVAEDPSDDSATDQTTITVETALSISKSDGEDSAVAGVPVSYEIVVTNAGPSDAIGAVVTDTVPPGLTGVTWNCTAGTGASCSGSGTGNIGDTVSIPVGGSVTYHLHGVVDPALTGELSNTASVTAPAGGTDPQPGDNAATDVDAVVPVADLWVTKSDGVDEVIPGTAVTWTIVVGNDGPSDGIGTVRDLIPGMVHGATWTCTAGPGATCSASGTGDLDDVVTVPAGTQVTYTVTGTLSPAAVGTLANTVTVTVGAGINDPNLLNNTATDTDTLTPSADLSVSKTDQADPVGLEQAIVYHVTVTNLGPSDAQDVQVSDVLPAGVSLVGTSGCGEDPSGVPVCSLGTLGVGGSAVFTITAAADPGTSGVVTNTATVSSAADDPDGSNNSATEDTLITRLADLALAKTDDVDPVVQGGTLIYTLTVSNAGPNDATDVVITDTLPAGVSFELSQGCTEDPGGVPTCTVGSVPVGDSRQVTVVVTVSAPAGTVLTNTASVTAGSTDLDPSDDTATEDTTVAPGTDLVVTKTNGVEVLGTGLPVTYTMVVENRGPADAATVYVNDPVPPELVGATWTCTPSGAATCSASGSGDIVDTASIPVGDRVTYTLTATVDPSLTDPTEVVNTITVSADGLADPHPADNTATDADPIQVGRYFSDGFETGDTSRWSGSQGKRKKR